MKASWLSAFRGDLNFVRDSNPSVVAVSVFHRHGGTWYEGHEICGDQEFLSKAISVEGYLKFGKQKRYVFPIPDVDVIVELKLDLFPKSGKLAAYRKIIDQIRDNSQHRFDALHDSLTGCRNRKSFDKAISAAIDEVSRASVSEDSSLKQGGASSLTLISIDIDFFKRINDSRGHDYGDLVLRAFSWNIQDFCAQAEVSLPGVDLSVYRLGGEEFNVLAVGAVSEQEVLSFAENLRRNIESSVTPADSQVAAFVGDSTLGDVVLPDSNERRVTASFGISRLIGSSGEKSKQKIIDDLKTKADKALYSAKSSGRNRVRYFPDIIKKYGRVIEYDKEARVVIIDIGSEVGVVRGREFFVIPEKYTGEVDYIIDDGRSQRKLGTYPRIRIAKAVAFNVQAEISFCSVAESNDGVEITPGALLESIPLGLFGGLSGSYAYSESPAESDARLAIKKWVSEADWDVGRVMAIRFIGIRDVETSQGAVKANEILAGAAAAAKRILPTPVKVHQTEIGQFGVTFSCDDEDLHAVVDALVVALRDLCVDVVDFTLGVADQDSIDGIESDDFSLDISFAYEYAKIAAAASDLNSWRKFDENSPDQVMRKNEEDKEFEKIVADYENFKDLGIVGAIYENRAGVSYFATGALESANSCFRAAIEFSDDDAVIKSNFAITQFMLGRFSEAFDQISAAHEIDAEYPRDSLKSLYAVAAIESFILRGEPVIEKVIELFEAADAMVDRPFLRPGVYERARQRALAASEAE